MTRKSRLSIEEIMMSFGSVNTTSDPNVYIQEEELSRNPIHYPFGIDHYAILIICSGECEVKVNFDNYTLAENSMMISPPNCIYHFLSISHNLKFKLVSFSTRFVDELHIYRNHSDQFNFLAFKYPNIITLNDQQKQNISKMIEMLNWRVDMEDTHLFKNEIVLHTLAILTFEITAAFKNTIAIQSKQLSRKEDLVRKFLELVYYHFKTQHYVDFYSEKLFVTSNYLSKITKSEVGKSATEIIEDMLVLEANVLLRQTANSVAQVATMLCFSDQFVFSKFFKRKTNQSPSAYRKS